MNKNLKNIFMIMFTFPSRTTALTFTDWRHLEFKIIHAQRGKEIQRKTIIGILGKKKHMRRQSIGILPPPEGALQDQLAGCWKSIFICVLCIIYLMKWGPGLEHSLKMFCEWLAKKRRELLTLKLHELWRWPVCQEEYFDNVAWDIIPNSGDITWKAAQGDLFFSVFLPLQSLV